MDEAEKNVTALGANAIDILFGAITGVAPFNAFKSLTEVIDAVREQNTRAKYMKFLKQLEDLSEEEIKTFYRSIGEDLDAFKTRLILLIDRLDELEKARIIGNLTKGRITRKISHPDYLRMCLIVDRIFLLDLEWLSYLTHVVRARANPTLTNKDLYDQRQELAKRLNVEIAETNLFGLGLLEQKILGDKKSLQQKHRYGGKDEVADSEVQYSYNELAVELIQFGYFDFTDAN